MPGNGSASHAERFTGRDLGQQGVTSDGAVLIQILGLKRKNQESSEDLILKQRITSHRQVTGIYDVFLLRHLVSLKPKI